MNIFDKKLHNVHKSIAKKSIEILQVNLGKLCNLTCSHCHVEAGPSKTEENMNLETAQAVVRMMDVFNATTLDLTGGAPELNPHFKFLVGEAKKRNMKVIDRCNLTVFFEEGMGNIPEFLSQNNVEVVASLPCYLKDNVDEQRGKGVFDESIKALQWLNKLGYGCEDSGRELHLVYNPTGPYLPPDQKKLQAEYKEKLGQDLGIVFNELYTITNMPISRYEKYLKVFGQYEGYVDLLLNSFNVGTIDGLMCLNTLSVSWDGKLYDCDFNQVLNMQMYQEKPLTVFDVTVENVYDVNILTAAHCFGCTAGAGSSCQGALE